MTRRTYPADIEALAAEFLLHEGEVMHGDNCDGLSDAAMADKLATRWHDRLGKLDFEQLVDAFDRLRRE